MDQNFRREKIFKTVTNEEAVESDSEQIEARAESLTFDHIAEFSKNLLNDKKYSEYIQKKERKQPEKHKIDPSKEKKIFNELCKKEDYKNNPVCSICKQKFGVFLFSKNCKFCGSSVCNEELIKERADPQNPKNFHPICKICEFKYIEKRISDENKNKDNIHKVEKEVLTKKLAEIEAELKKKKNDYKEKKQEEEAKMNILAEKIKKLKIETYNLDRSIDKHTFDKMTIIENVNNIELIMEKNNIKIIEIEGECDDLKKQESELMQRIKARESDIRQTVAYNKELENKLARISIDFHYSSVLAESYPKILEEKVFNKSFLDESRSTRVFSENEEPLLTYSKEENCCKKCEIF